MHNKNKFQNNQTNIINRTTKLGYYSVSIMLLIPLIAAIFILPPNVPAQCADSESGGIKVYCNGDYQGGTAYIDPASGVGMIPLVLIQNIPGLRLDVRDNQAWFALNGKELSSTIGSNTYIIDGQSRTWRCGLQSWKYGIAVPGRDLFEALEAEVSWEEKDRAIYITTVPPAPSIPENLSQTSLPLRLAFIQDEQLWLLDASEPGSQPFPVPSRNVEQIIGWSYDGKWLAYLQRMGDDKYSGDMNLWVVAADGRNPQCLDELVITYSAPVWAPAENTIAYQAIPGKQTDAVEWSLRIAAEENGRWQHHVLLPWVDQRMGLGMTWFPDGRSLLVSRVHDENNLPELDRVDLQGETTCLFVLPADVAGDYQDGLYIRDISGLKLSPDGRYLACFLGMNSASLNADGMGLHIIDLQQNTLSINLGPALGYPEWVQWSPDSRHLAAILGCDRMASTNKHLVLVQVDANGLNVNDLGETGHADSRPMWSANGNTLYFSRGQESEAWLEEGRHQEVQVPGQQIFHCRDNHIQSLSKPGDEQADYPLSLSPDGQYLAMHRLDYVDQGDLCLLNLKDSQMVILMENIEANAGYYGSYFPDMISIYWFGKF